MCLHKKRMVRRVLGRPKNSQSIEKARELGIFAPHNQDNGLLTLPIDWDDEIFLPFDWSYASFVFDTTKTKVPSSFEELANLPDDIKIVIQDPRSSISGLALVLWIKKIYGKDAGEYWQKLAPKIFQKQKHDQAVFVSYMMCAKNLVPKPNGKVANRQRELNSRVFLLFFGHNSGPWRLTGRRIGDPTSLPELSKPSRASENRRETNILTQCFLQPPRNSNDY